MRCLTMAWFVGVEVGGGFEGEAEVIVGAAFVGVEDQRVGDDVERDGDVAEHVEGGCAGARFVAADLICEAGVCWLVEEMM